MNKGIKKAITLLIAMMITINTGMCIVANAETDTEVLITEEAMDAYIDSFLAEANEKYHTPNMSIAVVYNGTDVLVRGEGLADIENERPVDPYMTRFPIGSASKTLVYISIMQLEEKGLLDLRAPVTNYVDLDLNFTKDDSVTLLDLMNHKAGFEEHLTAVGAISYENVLSLEDYLEDEIPNQLREAGTYSAYSNYGNVLLAHVVEEVTGMSYDDYIHQNILDVLGMNDTSIRQDFKNQVKGYLYKPETDTYTLQPEFYWNVWPAGGVVSTASDMSKLLTAYMNGGEFQGNRILSQESMARLLITTSSAKEGFSGLAHGFIKGEYNGYTYVGHGGTTPYHHTQFNFFPELEFGYYITSGSDEGRLANVDFVNGLIDEFYENKAEEPVVDKAVDVTAYAGAYSSTRNVQTNFLKIMRWFQDELLTPDGQALVTKSGVKIIPVDERNFVSEDGNIVLYFELDQQGNPIGYHSSSNPTVFVEKLPTMEGNGIQFQLIGIMILFLFVVLIRRLLAALIRKFRRRDYSMEQKKLIKGSNLIIAYIVVAGIGLCVSILMFNQAAIMTNNLLIIKLVLTLMASFIPLTLYQLFRILRSLKIENLTRFNRLEEITILLLCTGIVSWLQYWRLFLWYAL